MSCDQHDKESRIQQMSKKVALAAAPPINRLERRLRRFVGDLRKAWKRHSGFHAFEATLDGVDFDRAASDIDAIILDHTALVCARDDTFITEVLPTIPLLRDMQLETVWDDASATNRGIIWMNIDIVLSAASTEMKTVIRARDETRPPTMMKGGGKGGMAGIGAAMAAMGMGGNAEQIAGLLSKFVGSANFTPDMMQQFTSGEAGVALKSLMSCPEIFEALGATVGGLKEAGVSADGMKSLADSGVLDSLRTAMRHKPVRQHMKTVIAHFAPVLSKLIKNAKSAGADASSPAMKIVLQIIDSAEGHAWAKMLNHFGTPEGAEAILDIASSPNPGDLKQEQIAKAMGVEVEQLPELLASLKHAASKARDNGPGGANAGGFASIVEGLLGTVSSVIEPKVEAAA